MYNNAGIRSHHNITLLNARHAPSTSDPPPSTSNSLSSSSSPSIFGGHASRGSEDRIFSASAPPSRPGSAQVNRGTDKTTTAVLAPPSSFHTHSKTTTNVTSFTRKPSHFASSSVSSATIYNNNTLSSSSSSSFLSRTALSKPVAQTAPSVSRSSSMSCRNGSSGSIIGPAETATSQRINMKRLMSKPTAILLPDRAQSVVTSVAQAPPYDTDDSQSIEDHLAIKSHSLDILRRSKRRSRSVDLALNFLGPSSYPSSSSEGPLHNTTTNLGVNSAPGTARLPGAEGCARGLTRSPSTPGTARPASIIPPDYSDVDPPSLGLVGETVNSPLSPASVIALEWTQSQKHANPSSPIAGLGESSPSSIIPQAGFIVPDSSDNALLSPIVFADANKVPHQTYLSSPPIIKNSPRETEEVREDGNFIPSPPAEQGRRPLSRSAVRDVLSPTTKGRGHDGSKVGIAATMWEVSRRFTGAFGRGERKPSATRFPINHPSSFSIAPFSPDLDSNASLPLSFSARAASKASSHPRARSLTMSCITGAVKNESLTNNHSLQGPNQPLLIPRQPTNPFTTEFGQLNHTPLSIHVDRSIQDSVSERDNLVEVATLQQHHPEMLDWSLCYPSSPQRTIVGENDHDLALSRQNSSQLATPPLSPIGQTSSPARNNNNPNSPRKRSRSTLGMKPSHLASVPVSCRTTEGTETKGSSSSHVFSSTPPSLALNEGTVAGGKLRGLVRKLSSGTLGRNSDKSRSSHTRDSPPISREIRAAGADDVPPVPQIPKNFELIWDPDTFLAERARLRREAKFDSDEESTRSGQRSGGSNAALRIPSSSHMSSYHSSLLGHKEQMPADASSLSSSVKSRLRIDTDLDRGASSLKQSPVPMSIRRKPPPSIHGAYIFPRRANTAMEDSSPRNSQVDCIRAGSRSSSPSRSGTELHEVNRQHPAAIGAVASGSFEEKKSLSSHSHEKVSSYPNSIIAQPIMSPRDLYQHGEDEAATLRRQKNRESSLSYSLRNQKSVGALPASRSVAGSQKQPSAKAPPPTLSPRLLPLTSPPPRPPRRGTRMRSSTVLEDPTPRPMHHHQRSLSSPVSPTEPTFVTTETPDSLALSERLRGVDGRPRSPQPPTFKETPPFLSTRSHLKSIGNISLGNKANYLLHRVVRPRGSESASSVSSNPITGERSTKGGSQPKIRVKTSLGTITRAKAIATANSAPHTPSSSTSYTFSPQSSGNCTSSSRDHSSSQGCVPVGNGEPPPVPFTSAAFTFRGISPVTGPSPAKGRTLTEREREDLWNALLSRSDRVGGTLTMTTEGSALLSDNASFRED